MVRIQRACWIALRFGGIWGAEGENMVGGNCLRWRAQSLYWLAGARWESLAVVDLEIFGRLGGRINLWLRIWDLLVVAELAFVGSRGGGNSALWRSWDSLGGAELEFIGSG